MHDSDFSISHFLGHTHNFDKKDNDLVETFDLPYDYESLMHYPNNAFAKPGANVTIVSKVQVLIDFFFENKFLRFSWKMSTHGANFFSLCHFRKIQIAN